MSKSKLKVKYPKADDLVVGVFAFIDNSVLRQNIAIAFQYASFLVSLDAEYGLGGAIRNSVFKNTILFSASIAEGLINWKLHKMISENPELKESCSEAKTKYSELCRICDSSTGGEVFAAIKGKEITRLNLKTDFAILNRYAKRTGLFGKRLYGKAEWLRIIRNKVHLASLETVDDKYKARQIEACFRTVKEIIECVSR